MSHLLFLISGNSYFKRRYWKWALSFHVYRKKGISFVSIDQDKPLSDQGPFDVVLHKVCGSLHLSFAAGKLSFFFFPLWNLMDCLLAVTGKWVAWCYSGSRTVPSDLLFLQQYLMFLSLFCRTTSKSIQKWPCLIHQVQSSVYTIDNLCSRVLLIWILQNAMVTNYFLTVAIFRVGYSY